MTSSGDDSDGDFSREEWDKIQDAGCNAEQQILVTFVTNVPAPSLADCQEAITMTETCSTADILAQFKHEEHAAFKDMWENRFSEDVVRSYADMGIEKRVMFQYAVNRIFRKLAYEHPEHAKNKRIRYKWYTEPINAALVLCMVNKTHICPVWGLD
tara:strand:+ start:58 stop:525 length:468 start_codon:yes stop_codon:yes gene_type:complete